MKQYFLEDDPIHFTVTKVGFIADSSSGFNTFKIIYHEMISADIVDLCADYPIHEWSLMLDYRLALKYFNPELHIEWIVRI